MDEDGAKEPPNARGNLQRAEVTGPFRARLLGDPDEKVQGGTKDGVQAGAVLGRLIESLPNECSHDVLTVLEHFIRDAVHARRTAARCLEDTQDGLP
eukprot:3219393-Alexandrium_andersonii.AAC.1